AHKHEAQPQDNFALTVGGDGAAADFVADLDRAQLAQQDRLVFVDADLNVAELLQVDGAAQALDQNALAALPEVAAADVAIVLQHGFDDLVEVQFVVDELIGVEADHVLLLVAAPAVD